MIQLVPGRDCGECTVCCWLPTIDKPEIQKVSGIACRHCVNGCAIYEARPPVCRDYYCAWRRLPDIPQSWRPDQCGVMASIETDIPPQFTRRTGILLMLCDNPLKTIRQEWFVDFVARCLREGVPVQLGLPGPVGHKGTKVLLNSNEMIAIRKRSDLKRGLEKTLTALKGHKFVRHIFQNSGNDVSS